MSMDIFFSTTTDGSMKSPDNNFQSALETRSVFLNAHSIEPSDTTLVRVTYDSNDYCRYVSLGESAKGDGVIGASTIISDALVVTQPNHALLLPLADCIGAVFYDASLGILMVSHLGRQALEQSGGKRSVEYLATKHTVDSKNLSVWLSPAAGATNYPLYAFDNRSMHEVAIEQLVDAGVARKNIDTSPLDTTTDSTLFSHSQFLKGNRETDGRFAIVAVMR